MKKVIIIVLVLVLGGVGGFFGYKFFMGGEEGKEKEPELVKVEDLTADELAALTIKMDEKVAEFEADLADGGKIKIKYDVVLDNEKAHAEYTTRSSQMTSTALETFMSKSTMEIQGTEGKKNLELALQKRLNTFLKEGKVIKVYITMLEVR